MAPKRILPLEDPPSASSSSEGEETGSEEEIDTGEEEEPKSTSENEFIAARKLDKKTHKPLSSPTSKPPTAKSPKEEDESGTESESESESNSDPEPERAKPVANPNVKPILSKPVNARGKEKVAEKRSSDVDADSKEAKRAKEGASDIGDKSSDDIRKQQLFQRLWSEEDEVAVLEGLINFGAKNGVDVVKDMTSFHEFIKKDLHIDVSLTQLKDKVVRIKKKFDNNRKGKMGEEKIFNKGHDQKIFELSKKIWGSEVTGGASGDSAFKSNGKVKAKQKAKAGASGNRLNVDVKNTRDLKLDFDRSSGMEEYILKKGAELLEGVKKVDMEEKLWQLHVEELKLFLKRNELVGECTKKVLAAYDTQMDEDE